MLTITEAHKALRISKATLYRFFRQKKLKSVRLGRRRFIRPDELARFVKASESR